MKRILILSIGLLFTGELEVEGDLKVSGNIDVQNNPIKNVGTPVLDTDATNLSTVRSMLGMKPDRIYSHKQYDNSNYSFTVPENKFWEVVFSLSSHGHIKFKVNSNEHKFNVGGYFSNPIYKMWFIPGDTFDNSNQPGAKYLITIFEYSISGSGTDQGMDYIEP